MTETYINGIDSAEFENIPKGLIRDRTQTDVDYALECERGGIYSEADLKGAYNISDRNRVGRAVNYLSDCVRNTGRHEMRVNIREDWNVFDIVGYEDNKKTLNALESLRWFLPYDKMQPTPQNLDSLTYQKANLTEDIIFDLYGVLSRLLDSWLYCGDGFASDFDPFNWQGWDGGN